jgi:uncharacterized protein YcbK (DUF882 family)
MQMIMLPIRPSQFSIQIEDIMQVTKNFKLSELEFSDPVPAEKIANASELLQNLQIIRDHFQRPIVIISGYRSPERNAAVGGADKSQHLEAKAADIKIAGVPTEEIYNRIDKLISQGKIKQGGLGKYIKSGFVHYDVRGTKARWEG